MEPAYDAESPTAVAIVGMAGRFPGAPTLDAFWRNLEQGVESVSRLSDEEVRAAGVPPELAADPNYVRAVAIVDGVEQFDAGFFGFNPREAELADPQQRVLLECAWEAIESAGYPPGACRDVVGVYAGSHRNTYVANNLSSHPELVDSHGGQILLGNDSDFVATTVSYRLNLTGPSVNVQTACSTSLVAVYLAVQGLLNYDCDMALAGGVSIVIPQRAGYRHNPGGVMSKDGHCRAFDAAATGSVPGNGVGVVVLKRLADAIANRDRIRAVIRGVAINNDGARKVGYAAPSVQGQAEVIALAQAAAGRTPESIGYVEAHGTGTALGDPIEIAALTKAFASLPKKGFCAIGTVKTNIGHLDAAAGVAGLIKTVLMLEHGIIPPSLHFTRPNPQIDFASSPFYVSTSAHEWRCGDAPRRAAVSAFGIGGTNAHAILEEAPPVPTAPSDRNRQLVVLSARSETALLAMSDRLAAYLDAHRDEDIADVAYTSQVGRQAFRYRAALVCQSAEDAIEALRDHDPRRLLTATVETVDPTVAFLFPGLGDHYPDMARQLYVEEPVFREQVDLCCDAFQRLLGIDLRPLIYPQPEKHCSADARPAQSGPDLRAMLGRTACGPGKPSTPLDRTAFAHPALFVIEYSLAKLWMGAAVKPSAMLGYSLGEYVAACVSGVLSLKDALLLVARRAELVDRLPAGGMLAVPLPESEVAPLLGTHLAIAAINGPSLSVVAGPAEDIAALECRLVDRGVACRRLRAAHAFHSPMMKPVAAALSELARRCRLRPPSIPYISNVTGTWIKPGEATDPEYWATHLCRTVRFADGLEQVCAASDRVLLEVGPGHGLCSLALQHAQSQARTDLSAVSCLRHDWEPRQDIAVWLRAVAGLWLSGVDLDWPRLHDGKRCRVCLPTYPFERQRYWIEPRRDLSREERPRAVAKRADVSDWFYVPVWRRAARPAADIEVGSGKSRLVFGDASGTNAALAERLARDGEDVTVVVPGPAFTRSGDRMFSIRPGEAADYDRLLEDLASIGRMPPRIVHAWSASDDRAGRDAATGAAETGFYSLLFLTQALARQRGAQPLQLDIMTAGAQDVSGADPQRPAAWLIHGLSKVIPQEHPNVSCRTIDIPPGATDSVDRSRLLELLTDELRTPARGDVVAFRANQRWVQTFAPPRFAAATNHLPLRERGVYLMTGGFGKIGTVLADYLGRTLGGRLVLLGRSVTDAVRAQVAGLESRGVEVLAVAADAADDDQMNRAVAEARARFGTVHGVIHLAGITDAGAFPTLAEMDRAACERHFRAKVRGVEVLAGACRDLDLDFVALFSSSSAFLGGIGFGAYAAANSFMNGFALSQMRTSRCPWISMNWDTWHLAADGKGSGSSAVLGATVSNLVMNADEAIEAFRRALASGAGGPVVISPGDLDARARMWVELAEPAADTGAAFPRHPRPRIRTPYVAPRDSIEQTLAEAWQGALGIDAIGIHDNFFELGGHSLLGTRLIAKLRQIFDIELSLRSVFEKPTIAEFAEVVLERQAARLDAGTLSQILSDLQNATDEQTQAMLAADDQPAHD